MSWQPPIEDYLAVPPVSLTRNLNMEVQSQSGGEKMIRLISKIDMVDESMWPPWNVLKVGRART